MTWLGANVIETASGGHYDFLSPDPDEIRVEDIAHALSNSCRFGGHTSRFYSVAEHSVLVSRIIELKGFARNYQFAGLHHDGQEAFVVDVPRPLKPLLGREYGRLAYAADAVIAKKLGISPTLFHCSIVKRADEQALFSEGAELMHTGPGSVDEPLPGGLEVVGYDPPTARKLFLARHDELMEETG